MRSEPCVFSRLAGVEQRITSLLESRLRPHKASPSPNKILEREKPRRPKGATGAVQLTHSARTDCGQDFIGPEALARYKRHQFQLIWRNITQKLANPPNLPR